MQKSKVKKAAKRENRVWYANLASNPAFKSISNGEIAKPAPVGNLHSN